MAAPPGFEPRRTDPESVMLPLHHGAKLRFGSVDLLPRQGSNLNSRSQNPVGCQLPHEASLYMLYLSVAPEGFEPTRPRGHRILKPGRLPFRHGAFGIETNSAVLTPSADYADRQGHTRTANAFRELESPGR